MPNLALHVNVYESENENFFTIRDGGATVLHPGFTSSQTPRPWALSSISALKSSSRRSRESGQCLRRASCSSNKRNACSMRSRRAALAARGTRGAMLERDPDMLVDQPVQVRCHALRGVYSAEVHDVYGFRLEREHPVDRAVQRWRIEMHRSGGRKHELAAVAVEFAVRQPEGVAGEDMAARRVAHHDVMARVAGGIMKTQFAPCEPDRTSVHRGDDALRRYRRHLAVHAAGHRRAIDGNGPLDQPGGICHVALAESMHREPCVRTAAHEFPPPRRRGRDGCGSARSSRPPRLARPFPPARRAPAARNGSRRCR